MKILEKKLDQNNVILKVKATAENFKKVFDKELEKATKTVNLPGFRPGKAPYAQAVKAVDHIKVEQKTLQLLAEQLAEEIDASNAEETNNVVGRPIDIAFENKDENGEVTYSFTYETLPKVTLSDYQKIITNNLPINEIDDAEIEKYIKAELDKQTTLESKNAASTNEDVVVFDFEGSMNGTVIPEAVASNYELDLKNSNFIPGFAEELVNLVAGTEKTFDIKFPENYHAENLKNQIVTFKIKVNDIKAKKVPTLDDDFVKHLHLQDVNNVEQYKKYCHNFLSEQQKQKQKEQNNNAVINWVLSDVNVLSHFPMKAITEDARENMQNIREQIDTQFKSLGGFSAYLKMLNQTEESIWKTIFNESASKLKIAAVLDEIIKKENLQSTDDEVAAFKDEFFKLIQKQNPNAVLNEQMDFKKGLLEKKAIDFLSQKVVYEPAKVVETPSNDTPETEENK